MTNGILEHFSFLISMCAYSLLLGITVTLGFLYRKAYYGMKRTPVIRSIMYLMWATVFDTLFFGIITLVEGMGIQPSFFSAYPYLLIVPKTLMIFAFGYFLYTSISPNPSFDGKRVCPYPECYLNVGIQEKMRKK